MRKRKPKRRRIRGRPGRVALGPMRPAGLAGSAGEALWIARGSSIGIWEHWTRGGTHDLGAGIYLFQQVTTAQEKAAAEIGRREGSIMSPDMLTI